VSVNALNTRSTTCALFAASPSSTPPRRAATAHAARRADRFVVVDIERIAVLAAAQNSHMRISACYDRELVVVVADIVRMRFTSRGDTDPPATATSPVIAARMPSRVIRPTRYSPALTASGKPAIVHAVADEVRPHGDDDVDWHLLPGSRIEEKPDERDRFVA
jgi:hypothetical protein